MWFHLPIPSRGGMGCTTRLATCTQPVSVLHKIRTHRCSQEYAHCATVYAQVRKLYTWRRNGPQRERKMKRNVTLILFTWQKSISTNLRSIKLNIYLCFSEVQKPLLNTNTFPQYKSGNAVISHKNCCVYKHKQPPAVQRNCRSLACLLLGLRNKTQTLINELGASRPYWPLHSRTHYTKPTVNKTVHNNVMMAWHISTRKCSELHIHF